MDLRPLPGEWSARVRARPHLSQYLVLQVPSARHIGPAHADSRDRAGAATVRLRPHLDHAAARRLVGQQEADSPPLSPRGPTGAHASAAQEAAQSPPRRGAAGEGPRSSVEHGLCPRPARHGRAFRVLTVIDQWSRESVLMEANVALTGQSVVDATQSTSSSSVNTR